MRVKLILYLFLVVINFSFYTKAQIMPFSYENTEFTLINPSSFGQINGIELGLINRSRFVNTTTNARTSGFLFNTSFNIHKSEKQTESVINPIGIGAVFLNGTSHIHQVNEISLNYSYRIPLTLSKPNKYREYTQQSSLTKLNISFGISTSLRYSLNHYNDLYYDETRGGVDPLVDQNENSKLQPNIGIGIKLDNPKFATSLSIPRMLDNNNELNLENIRFNVRVEINLSNNIKFYPMGGITMIKNFSQGFTLGSQFIFQKDYGIGILGRNNNSMELSLHFYHPNERLRANYHFSILSNFQEIGSIVLPVHELSVFYILPQ